MKNKDEIDTIAWKFYVDKDGIVPNTYEREGFTNGYTQCQQDMADVILDELEKYTLEYEKDMADKKLDIDDINKMALDYIINNGGLPDSVEALQYCLHKFYEQINKQD
jgi:hypothetical protein